MCEIHSKIACGIAENPSLRNVIQLRQSPYSPNIVLCYFWLFPRSKLPLKGHRVDNKETVETNTTSSLKDSPKTASGSRNSQGSALFNQIGTTLKDTTSRITKKNTSAETSRQVGCFWYRPRRRFDGIQENSKYSTVYLCCIFFVVIKIF